MKKGLVMAALLLLLVNIGFVAASGDHEETFALAEKIIQQKVPCEDLSNEQLEILGDYYMEQMHPGEQHEFMDEMMGGEGSESLRQMHIIMGKAFYCGEHDAMSGDGMGMMMGRGGMMGLGGMMGGGVVDSSIQDSKTQPVLGTMWWFGYTVLLLLTIAMIVLIVVIIKILIENNKKRGRK